MLHCVRLNEDMSENECDVQLVAGIHVSRHFVLHLCMTSYKLLLPPWVLRLLRLCH